MVTPPKAAKAMHAIVDKKDTEAIAKELDVSESTLRNYLAGRQVPSLETALRIEKLYRIPAQHWLLMEAGQ